MKYCGFHQMLACDRQKSRDLSGSVETVCKNGMETDKDDERITERVM